MQYKIVIHDLLPDGRTMNSLWLEWVFSVLFHLDNVAVI